MHFVNINLIYSIIISCLNQNYSQAAIEDGRLLAETFAQGALSEIDTESGGNFFSIFLP